MPRIKRADEAGCIYHALRRGKGEGRQEGAIQRVLPYCWDLLEFSLIKSCPGGRYAAQTTL
ncbi:hypothetical protein CA13_03400 [Planctomycetes bacterium CA13]|uniref:Uncharacterized protein n=1 Tax=Novipirellula herctigrandis TaxID=2527986 RepID=A0A5C5YWL9_9BACT|nr:hypothetical protein CA13_03400 [Planctomycetes bacterium CA13]